MSRPVGDECYICPSCGNHLGGYGRTSKGSSVLTRGLWSATLSKEEEEKVGYRRSYRQMDLVQCHDCGVVFAVDDLTVPSA